MPVGAGRGACAQQHLRAGVDAAVAEHATIGAQRSGGVTKRTSTVSVADVTAGAAAKYWLVS